MTPAPPGGGSFPGSWFPNLTNALDIGDPENEAVLILCPNYSSSPTNSICGPVCSAARPSPPAAVLM
jgi:hypothetical protein